jgi:hypothetical protein
MGSECSHDNLEIFNEGTDIYNDNIGIWNYKLADAKCNDCKKTFRAKKRICVSHGIEQPWEVINPIYCNHDMLVVRDKKRNVDANTNKGRYTGEIVCVKCGVSAPAFTTFEVRGNNGNNFDHPLSEWKIIKKST